MKWKLRIISLMFLILLSNIGRAAADTPPTIESQFTIYASRGAPYNLQTLDEWIYRPNHTEKFEDIDVTILELLGTQGALYTTYHCKMNLPNARLCFWTGFEHDLLGVDQFPPIPVYYVSIQACIDSIEGGDWFSPVYSTDNSWQEMSVTILNKRFSLQPLQWISVEFKVFIARIYEGEWIRKEESFFLDYQMTPTLDACLFSGPLIIEEANYCFENFELQINPDMLFCTYDLYALDPEKSTSNSITFLDENWEDFLDEYSTSLPERIFLAVYDKNDMKFQTVYLLIRNGKQYVYHGKFTFHANDKERVDLQYIR